MFLINDRLLWQGFHAHQTCCSRLIQPSHSCLEETLRHSLMCCWIRADLQWGYPHGAMSRSCGHKWQGLMVTFLHFVFCFLSLQLRHVRADVLVSFSILGQCVTFFMMALYRLYYLPFYYLKIYYLFMRQFNLLFRNELLCGRTRRFKNAVAVDLASPGGELIQLLFI